MTMMVSKKVLFLAIVALPQVNTTCTDSTTYTFGTYPYNNSVTTRDCEWITKNPSAIDRRRTKFCDETIDGKVVKEECPLACDACPATPSPTTTTSPTSSPSRPPSPFPSPFPSAQPSPSPSALASEMPSSSPTRPPSPYPSPFPSARPSPHPSTKPSLTSVPTSQPSAAPLGAPTARPSLQPSVDPTNRPTESIKPSPSPSAAPTEVTESPSSKPSLNPTTVPTTKSTLPCVDTKLRLKIETINREKKYISRYCDWVGQKDIINRCAMPGVSAACPVTCNSCTPCADPSDEIRFKFEYNGKEIVRNCEYVGRIAGKVWGRCTASGNICRSTCGAC